MTVNPIVGDVQPTRQLALWGITSAGLLPSLPRTALTRTAQERRRRLRAARRGRIARTDREPRRGQTLADNYQRR